MVDLDLKTSTPIVSGWKINNGEIKPYGAAIEMAATPSSLRLGNSACN